MAVIGESVQCGPDTVFGDVVGWVVGVKGFFGVGEWVFGFPGIIDQEIFGVADMAFCPFQFVKFGKVLDKILVGLKRFGDLADVDYSSSSEFIPKRPDNGVG